MLSSIAVPLCVGQSSTPSQRAENGSNEEVAAQKIPVGEDNGNS